MFCPNCGTQNSDTAAFCSNCGATLKLAAPPPNPPGPQNFSNTTRPDPADDPGADTIIKVISFCVPLVGLILFLVWNRDRPKSARDACTFAAIGFGAGLLIYFIMIAFAAMVGN